jgi:hypothetical protein
MGYQHNAALAMGSAQWSMSNLILAVLGNNSPEIV